MTRYQTPWSIWVRDPDLAWVGELNQFRRLEAVLRHNGVGTWILDIDRRAPLVSDLLEPGAGIIVRHAERTVFSGSVRRRRRGVAGHDEPLTLTGVDDNVWLTRRRAHPQPATAAPPYASSAYDVHTGEASTVLGDLVDVNLGPAAVTARQLPGLAIGADPGIGGTATARGRYQELLTLLQEVADPAGLGFRIRQEGPLLVFDVYQLADRTDTVRISADLGTLGDYSYEDGAPDGTFVYVGGGGEGTARVIVERSDAAAIDAWGRIEVFQDRRDTTDAGELAAAGDETLAKLAAPYSLSMKPIDLPQLTWPDDFDLSDRVTVVIDGVVLTETIRELTITLADEGETVRPTIATPRRSQIPRMFARLRDLETALTDLQRR